ncbi:MAG: hypothetical protein IPG64_23215 [Haliea sp.]|nr:hypothetical protein [Haliea sp.]
MADGDDMPPSQRLSAEGMMETVALMVVATLDDLVAARDWCYRAAFGHGIGDELGDDWQGFFRFSQIPAMGRRAQVIPSTRDRRRAR